jgi:hypothetical protein
VITSASPRSGRTSPGRPRVTTYWITTDTLATECVVGEVTRALRADAVTRRFRSAFTDLRPLDPQKGRYVLRCSWVFNFRRSRHFLCIGELA